MRVITLKWANDCAECGKDLQVGSQAAYEKKTGIFCPEGCFPTDPEKIRAFRMKKAEAKAARYEEWADKRRQKSAALYKTREPFRGDIAFWTQPGRIPFRDRIMRNIERAGEEAATAERFEHKADSLRNVQVKGDAERRRQAERDAVSAWVQPDMMVDTIVFGVRKVLKVNKKTVTIQGNFGKFNVDKSFLRKTKEAA